MNVERILSLADFLETLETERLVMDNYSSNGHECGTVACIAGWENRRDGQDDETVILDNEGPRAAVSLGLQSTHHYGPMGDQAHALFLPFANSGYHDLVRHLRATGQDHPLGPKFDPVTAKHAVLVLRHLAATGEVDWRMAIPEEARS